MNKRLSVIIPMYNVAAYVERCVLSLEDQDIPKEDYEIICINDGSPDNCQEIVENLQKKFSHLLLINQENQGVSRARNSGIDISSGNYILFVDPDDYVEPMCISRILNTVKAAEAQVSFLGFKVLNQDGSIHNTVFNENLISRIYSGPDAYNLSRGDGRTDPDRMWAVLFSRDFLNSHKLRFLSDVPYLEDGEFIARILCLAERCIFDGQSFYQRTTRPGSATNSKLFHSTNATEGFLKAACNLKKFQEKRDLNEKQIKFLNQPVVKFIVLVINSCLVRSWYSKIKYFKNRLKENDLFKCNLEGCTKIYKFYGGAYNYSPYLLAIVLLIWPRFYRFFKISHII